MADDFIVGFEHRDDAEFGSSPADTARLNRGYGALRSGEIWVQGSRRYANPASYLIPPERWRDIRADTLVRTRAPTRFADRLAALEAELEGHLDELETQLGEPDADIRLDDDSVLHLSPLGAEDVDPRLQAEHDRLLSRLPHVQTAELLIEVDTVTNWTDHHDRAHVKTARAEPRSPVLARE